MDSQRYSRPNGTGKHSAADQSREQSRDLALKGAKRSPLTTWKCWKSRAKETKAVIERPSECQKQRVFQGGLDFDEKRGGGGRGSKMQNPREKRVSRRSEAVDLERILVEIVRVRAHLSSFSSNPGANVTKKDHFASGLDR